MLCSTYKLAIHHMIVLIESHGTKKGQSLFIVRIKFKYGLVSIPWSSRKVFFIVRSWHCRHLCSTEWRQPNSNNCHKSCSQLWGPSFSTQSCKLKHNIFLNKAIVNLNLCEPNLPHWSICRLFLQWKVDQSWSKHENQTLNNLKRQG